jgi:excisionase family DNA binding protein
VPPKKQPVRKIEDLPDVLTMAEIASYLNVSDKTVRRWVALGEFPEPMRYSKRLMKWRRADLAVWLRGRGGGPEAWDRHHGGATEERQGETGEEPKPGEGYPGPPRAAVNGRVTRYPSAGNF